MDWFRRLSEYTGDIGFADIAVVAVNLLLIIFAKPLMQRLSSGTLAEKTISFRVKLLQGLNVIILLVYGYEHIYQPTDGTHKAISLLSIVAIIYLTYLINYIALFLIKKNYGKEREILGKAIYIETYQTRILSIIASVLLTIIALISIVKQLGFDSLLEAGGVLGFIGVLLALTQASWAPDIISGLIILHSDMFEEGDIVDLENGAYARVYKTKLFHTEVLNIGNNHRIMIRNANLRDRTIHNLSKFASSKGLRECMVFKIGYDVDSTRVRAMFDAAIAQATLSSVPLCAEPPAEVKVLDTGDHAIHWGLLYYIQEADRLLEIRRNLREIVLNSANERSISLATPLTYTRIGGPN